MNPPIIRRIKKILVEFFLYLLTAPLHSYMVVSAGVVRKRAERSTGTYPRVGAVSRNFRSVAMTVDMEGQQLWRVFV